jgi:predicted Fe-S protein YdhL (DUF1289 family)
MPWRRAPARHPLLQRFSPCAKHCLSLAALLLGGCASHKPEDFNGTWINQDAIDAASKAALREALNSMARARVETRRRQPAGQLQQWFRSRRRPAERQQEALAGQL